MRRSFSFSPDQTIPERSQALLDLGLPTHVAVPDHTASLLEQALACYVGLARPAGVAARVSPEQFALVFAGQGGNEPETPVAAVFPQADHLLLFAVTVGDAPTREISRLFAADEFPRAAMLDAVTSAAADRAAALVEEMAHQWCGTHPVASPLTARRYSPGYCGWHISGQKQLFDALRPEAAGITLRDSFLMEPLKSISGVVILGPPEIHRFPGGYSFCRECRARECGKRPPP